MVNPARLTPELVSETRDLIQPFFPEKELTYEEILTLLQNVALAVPDPKTPERKRRQRRAGKKVVKNTAQVALKNFGIPTVRKHARGQFYIRIGYRRSAGGIRQRAFFYLGKNENAAVIKAAAIKHIWKELKKSQGSNAVWPTENKLSLAACFPAISPSQLPAAVEKFHQEASRDALDQGNITVAGRDRQSGQITEVDVDPSEIAENKMPRLRVEQVAEMYLEYRKGKLGIGGGQGINDKTYRNESRNLKSGLASLNPRTLIETLQYAEIERLRDDIFRRVGVDKNAITKRTANNYWNEVQRMLNWAHRQASVNYRHPEDVEDLFKQRFRNPNPVRIAEYDPAKLKKLVSSAEDRQRLYVYLALNCGYYQIDIGSLRRHEVVEKNGGTMIIRKRSKTAQQNDFEATHVLWSETAALLKREMAKSARFANNHDGLALLSNRGTSLYRKSPQCDLVGDSYLTLQHDAGIDLSFKQLRKIGATAMQRLGGDETRRLYKAGTIDDGDKVYVRETWAKLTPHLIAWGDELRLDGILFDRKPIAVKKKPLTKKKSVLPKNRKCTTKNDKIATSKPRFSHEKRYHV